MKKKTGFILITVLCVFLCLLFTACKEETAETITTNHSDVKIVYLGDSIAEGILGPAPLIEREDYAYASIVGQINGFTYRNRSVSGHMTWQMLNYISAEKDENAYTLISHIKSADILSISILGNDLLQTPFAEYANPAVIGDFTALDALLEESYENMVGIIARLKELNPTAPLIFHTVYNPAYKDTTLIGENIRSVMRENGLTDDDVYRIAGLLINRLNNVLRKYSAEHPGEILILDVNDKFDQLYRAGGNAKLDRLIFSDDIHPSDEGHATIAALLQEMLETMGYANHDEAIANYKILCKNRLKRLYTGTTVNLEETIKKIQSATTYFQINEAYFDATDGVNVVYERQRVEIDPDGTYDTYMLESVEVYGDFGRIALDSNKTYFKLQTDGNGFELHLGLSNLAAAFVRSFVKAGAKAVDLEWVNSYVAGVLTPESLDDVIAAFARMRTDLGFALNGIDLEDEGVQAMIKSIQEERKIPEGTEISKDISFSVFGTYESVEIPSQTQTEPFKAAYVGEHTALGETYLIFTFFEEDGQKKVLIHNDVLSLNFIATRVEPQEAE